MMNLKQVLLESVEVSVAAHLRGMRPAPTSQKDTVTLRENSNNTYLYSNSNYHNNMFF